MSNELTGPIPTELGNLSNLNWLYLNSNDLSGPIPSELGSLSNLKWLLLDQNQLTGRIPAELGGLTNLERVYLSENQLTGCIPYGLRQVVDNDFDELGLPFCADDDTVSCASEGAVADAPNNPDLVSDCDTLLAARDTLVGTATLNWSASIPIGQWNGVTAAGSPLRVTELDLFKMELTGEIPAVLGSLSDLRYLYLGNNRLTGEIPSELTDLSNLEALTLGGNLLTGSIPVGLGGLPKLEDLQLGANQLTGSIPSQLGSLSVLRDLGLGHNQLSGKIPTELGDLAALEQLSLIDNQLSGAIPAELGGLSNLRALDLRSNQLSGSIPAELGSLSNLESAEVISPNQLTGCTPRGLRDVVFNDLDELGLPFCDVLLSGLTVSPGSLVPQFDAYRTDYSASVGLAPVTVTVIPPTTTARRYSFSTTMISCSWMLTTL